eukprot:11414199-Alexandrium_andersonii.AAC.1
MHLLATPEARGALPRPCWVGSSAAAWSSGARGSSRPAPRIEIRVKEKALPGGFLIHTSPGGGRGARR